MRAELSRQRCSHNAKERTRRVERAESARGEGVARTGGTGLYVKGGRARCYLACSPDEISASSFRPSSLHSYLDLLLRVFLPRTPSSSSAFLLASPSYSCLDSPQSSCEVKNFFRARHCRTFDCVGISILLLSLSLFTSFPFLSAFRFYLNLSFLRGSFFFRAFPFFFLFFLLGDFYPADNLLRLLACLYSFRSLLFSLILIMSTLSLYCFLVYFHFLVCFKFSSIISPPHTRSLLSCLRF